MPRDLREERGEDVGLVVRGLGGEVFKTLRDGVDAGDAFEAHAGVDVLGRERGEGAVGVGVVLDEDVVPDLDALGGALVDQRALGVAGARRRRGDATGWPREKSRMALPIQRSTSSTVTTSAGGTPEKPVGVVWVAWRRRGRYPIAEVFHFDGDREAIRRQTVAKALHGLLALAD